MVEMSFYPFKARLYKSVNVTPVHIFVAVLLSVGKHPYNGLTTVHISNGMFV